MRKAYLSCQLMSESFVADGALPLGLLRDHLLPRQHRLVSLVCVLLADRHLRHHRHRLRLVDQGPLLVVFAPRERLWAI